MNILNIHVGDAARQWLETVVVRTQGYRYHSLSKGDSRFLGLSRVPSQRSTNIDIRLPLKKTSPSCISVCLTRGNLVGKDSLFVNPWAIKANNVENKAPERIR